MLENYIVVDMEMTGLNPKTDRILEIGAVKIKNHEIVETFSQLVNPHRELEQLITELTGITTDMSKEGIEDTEAVEEFLEFGEDFPLVGHNIISDYSFLQQCLVNQGKSVQKYGVDTLKLARRFLPGGYKKNLESLCNYAGIAQTQEHRAFADAVSTYRLLEWLLLEYQQEEEEAFLPYPLVYKVKRQGPITQRQKKNLIQLLNYHRIDIGMQIESLTRNEASRITDTIIFEYGRIPAGGR
ncbi:MAG: 3'-5' exonuclease [Lachnospiraceae bacterium]